MKDAKVLALVTKARGSNKKAFAKLCELKVNEIIFLCVREMGNRQDGQDAAQEVFIQMQKSLPNLQAPEAFNVWLNQLVHNTCNTMKRKTLRHNDMLKTEEFEDFLMDETLVTLQENMEVADNRRQIVSIIDGLPDKYRSCIVLHYYQNLSYAQIAEVLDISTDAVNNNMRMARKFIKREMERRQEFGLAGAVPLLAIGPLLTKSMVETAGSTVSAIAAKQCLAAAGVYTSAAAGVAAAGAAGGVAAKAIVGVAGVALAFTAGTGIYTVATNSSQSSPPGPAIVQSAGLPQGKADGAMAGAGGEEIPLGQPVAAIAAQTDNMLAGRVYLAHDGQIDPEALTGLDGAVVELFAAGDTGTPLATAEVSGSNDNGSFALEGMADGVYRLRVSLPGNAAVAAGSPAGLKSSLLDANTWLEWQGETDFVLENGTTQLTGLDLAVEMTTRVSGHLSLYFGGVAIEYDDGLLPGIYMELYDPQGKLVGAAPVTQDGEYVFENPVISQNGGYTLHVTADDTAPWALDIEDEEILLMPGFVS